jgi:DNA-binding MarR family transcriptional regulator
MTRRDPSPAVPEVDAFIHEPARLRLLALLSILKRADFVYLRQQSGLSGGNLSTQMGKLADSGYVHIEKSFVGNRPLTSYRLTETGRDALRAYKRTLQAIMDALPD